MHGVTKPVELDLVLNGTAVHPYTKKTIAGFKVAGTLKRSEFGIGTGTPSAPVSDDVRLSTNAEFIKDRNSIQLKYEILVIGVSPHGSTLMLPFL